MASKIKNGESCIELDQHATLERVYFTRKYNSALVAAMAAKINYTLHLGRPDLARYQWRRPYASP